MDHKVTIKTITIKGRIDARPVVTVILNNSHPTEQKDFHCTNCGKIVFSYFSDVRIILLGEVNDLGYREREKEVRSPVDIFCSHCKLCHRVI